MAEMWHCETPVMAEVSHRMSNFYIVFQFEAVTSIHWGLPAGCLPTRSPIDKARRIQDEHIKADRNYFVTWDNTLHKLPTTSRTSMKTKTSKKTRAEILARTYFGDETFDMCYGTEGDASMTVDTPSYTALADAQYGRQIFEMCFDPEVEPAPIITAETSVPPASPRYDLCWDEAPIASDADVNQIVELATSAPPMASQYYFCWDAAPIASDADVTPIMEPVNTPATEERYDMCWDDQPPASTFFHNADCDMCCGDEASGNADEPSGDADDRGSGLTFEEIVDSVNASYDQLRLASPAATPPPRSTGLASPAATPPQRPTTPSQMSDTSEEVLSRANMRLHNIDTFMNNDPGEAFAVIIDANRGLISEYREARDRFMEAGKDVAKIQHLMNLQRQIDDPLRVLLKSMRKMGRGDSPVR
ncbi:hypothetical protein DEU56DRAFT_755573 [Suillus clintonianus]|uniref:uncharacterized protein n=1 Tax=Suillus clintonianus TaxID=1904413 RepID=UPI001B86A882|nr:uncharacterized protein DEU56DRAFT_755573 [Suillus clintonianus]KAG2139260.1 hypothetical protein DEU56DRAFT_755573 [Suillus clintonianus]